MIKKTLLVAAFLTTSVVPLTAQPIPFDMTPESNLRSAPPAEIAPQSAPVPVPAPVVTTPPQADRYVMPVASVRLAGEESREAAVVYLTEAQASAPARLQLSYLNAVVVAPEISHLTVTINGAQVSRTPIASSVSATPIVVDLPPGLLQPGANTIAFVATQRHRTDCSVGSTFELWTEIAGSGAILSFEGSGLGMVSQLADLPAVGVDANGMTTVRLITPDLAQPEAAHVAIKLAQQLALAMRVPHLHIEQASALSDVATPGVLDVVMAPADQLPEAAAAIRTQAQSGAVAVMLAQPGGANTLVVSGPHWSGVSLAADAILASAVLSPARPRVDLPYDIPLVEGDQTLSLAELGVPTTEFNGRRYSTRFQFELPPDFYAENYGQAELILDAAYSSDVLPGSEIDIFTNSRIASATPLLRTNGGLLRNTMIRVPMTNLRPGRNEVDVVVSLNAQSDATCSPGWTGNAPVRFVFSSGSQIRLPSYARAAALPDLQMLTGSAWPYSEDEQVSLVVGEGPEPIVTAMTLLARAASASGRVLPAALIPEAQLQPDQNAIVVMPLSAMSPSTLERTGVLRASGANPSAIEGDLLNQFRLEGEPNAFAAPANWALQQVGLSLDDLRFITRRDLPYTVSGQEVALVQGMQAEGGLWTVLTAADNSSMLTGMQRLATTEKWRQIAGRVSTLAPDQDQVKVIETQVPRLVSTQPFSLWNLRLVAANWFSGNILAFTGVLAAAAVLLMLATALLLTRFGRQK
jgi:hypothetical protein